MALTHQSTHAFKNGRPLVARVETSADLRALYGEPNDFVRRKTIARLDRHCRHIISLSPFLTIATAGADGSTDVSPRGDAPGFVAVLDETHLAIPDRKGNRRLDTMENILERGHVGLLFMVPGIDETLRVNGTAEIHADAALNERLSGGGRPALAAIVVTVTEAYLHCGKALMRSGLWDGRYRVERDALPTLGEMMRDQIGEGGPPTDQETLVSYYRETLY